MKLYAIKDRLLDYFMTPFAAPSDKEVLGSIATTVNNYEAINTNGIAQAPHHFEIWVLAEIDEEGHVNPKREFLHDCSSLLRGSVRKAGGPEDSQGKGPPDSSRSPQGRPRETGMADQRSIANSSQATRYAVESGRQSAEGTDS